MPSSSANSALPATATGLDVRPFRALTYRRRNPDALARVSSPAYDLVTPEGRERLAATDPHNIVRLILPTVASGPGGARPVDEAARTLREWERAGVLERDGEPALWVYAMQPSDGAPATVGWLAAVGLPPDGSRAVLPHEDTFPVAVEGRRALLEATATDLEPIVLAHDLHPAVPALTAAAQQGTPTLELTDADGVRHSLWRVPDPTLTGRVTAALADTGAVIADGHHRWAAAAAAGRRLPTAGRTLVHLVDARSHGPRLKPVHRLVARLPPSAEQRLAAMFVVEPVPTGELVERLAGAAGRAFGLRLPGGRARLLLAADEDALQARIAPRRPPLWRDLDTAVLHEVVLPALDAGPVAYRAEVDDAVAELEASGQGALFVLRPVDVATVFACASAGTPMPAKTTMFSPKPRAGLVLRSLHSG